MLQVSKTALKGYVPPKRNVVSGKLLDAIHEKTMEKELKELKVDDEILGLSFLGNAATINKAPLLNVLAIGFYIPAYVINFVDCTNCLLEGEKKDVPFIAKMFVQQC